MPLPYSINEDGKVVLEGDDWFEVVTVNVTNPTLLEAYGVLYRTFEADFVAYANDGETVELSDPTEEFGDALRWLADRCPGQPLFRV